MADGASPHSKQNITVEPTPFSGSAMYVAWKHGGTSVNDLINRGFEYVEQQAKFADAILTNNEQMLISSINYLANLGVSVVNNSVPAGANRDAMKNWVQYWHANNLWALRLSHNMIQASLDFWSSALGVKSRTANTEPISFITKTIQVLVDLQKKHLKTIHDSDFLCSPEYAEFMWNLGKAQPEDTEVNARLNDRFFTHNSTQSTDPKIAGSLNEASAEQVQAHFKGPKENWPNLILTSSHALVRDHNDVSGMMAGWHALITQAYGNGKGNHRGKDLPLIRDVSDPSQRDPEQGKPTIMLSAVYNDRNAMVNGGTLLLRMHHLAKVGKQFNNLKPSPEERRKMEAAYLGNERDGTRISHASLNLAKLILSLMVQDPSKLGKVNDPNDQQLYKEPFITPKNPAEPIALREDADDVLQHIKLVGYSKGGTIVTDALRFLILQLKHPVNEKGDPSFVNHEGKAIDHTDITRMMTHMGVLCVNPGINPLSRREQQLGIRRMTIRNDNDIVTSHLFKKYADDPDSGIKTDASGDVDNVYVVNGSKENLGHGIEEALGSRQKSGYLMSTSDQDPEHNVKEEIKSRLQSFFASCCGKMGFSKVALDVKGTDCKLEVELSTGVTFKQFQDSTQPAIPAIIEGALEQAGLQVTSMEQDASQTSPYKGILTFKDTQNRSAPEIRSACRDALDSLNQQPEHNIFVSKTSLNQLKAPKVEVDTATHVGRIPTAVRKLG